MQRRPKEFLLFKTVSNYVTILRFVKDYFKKVFFANRPSGRPTLSPHSELVEGSAKEIPEPVEG